MVDVYDAVLENTYNFVTGHKTARGIVSIGEGGSIDIRILQFKLGLGKPRIYRYTPNYSDYFDPTQNPNGANGLCFDGTYLWYTTAVPCTSDSYGIRKVKPDGTGYVCVSNIPTNMNSLTLCNGNIYGYIGGKIYMLENDYTWTEVYNLTTIIGAYAFTGISAIEGGFLTNEHTNDRIHYITSAGVHTTSWNFLTCPEKGLISWDGTYLWFCCESTLKLYKLSLPNIPIPSVEKKKWCLGRVGVRFIKL